jgi:hypothetical protein
VFCNLGIGARKGSKQHRNGEGIPLLTWEASSKTKLGCREFNWAVNLGSTKTADLSSQRDIHTQFPFPTRKISCKVLLCNMCLLSSGSFDLQEL